MSGATSPDDDDHETQHHPHAGQQVSHTRVGQFLVQARQVGGNLTVNSGKGSWPVALVVVAVVALVAIVALVRPGHGQPKKTRQPVSRSPLSVTRAITPLQRVRASMGSSAAFVFFKPASTLPPLPPNYLEDPQLVERWGYGNSGVDANDSIVDLVIQGNIAKSVMLTDLRIKILSRVAAPRAISVQVYPGGDGVDGRWAEVNLDKRTPVLEGMRNFSYSGDHPNQRWSFPLRVSRTALEDIFLDVGTSKYDCQWTAELSYVADNKPGVVSINDNGKPFRTVSSANSRPYKVSFSDRRVIPGTYGDGSSD